MNAQYPMLAIETTGQLASVALKDEGGRLYKAGLTERLNHLKGLLPLVDGLLKDANLTIKDVKTIAVSQGPGSFTGIRIGISTVRALAQISGAKVIGVPTLETFVFNDIRYGGIVCPIFDARMNQMYAGAFSITDDGIDTHIGTGAYSSREFLTLLTELVRNNGRFSHPLDFRFMGDGLEVFKDDIISWDGLMKERHYAEFSMEFAEKERLQIATSTLKWAENYGVQTDYNKLLPVYVRQAEAQRRLDEKNAGK